MGFEHTWMKHERSIIIAGMVVALVLGVNYALITPLVEDLLTFQKSESIDVGTENHSINELPKENVVAPLQEEISEPKGLFDIEASEKIEPIIEVSTPSISVREKVPYISKPFILEGNDFIPNSVVKVTAGSKYSKLFLADSSGRLNTELRIREAGSITITATDDSGGTAKTSVIVKTPPTHRLAPPENLTNEGGNGSGSIGVLTRFTTDFSPPETTEISGKYNEASGWYYGSPPSAKFTATDEYSGVDYIIVQYAGACDSPTHECILSSGDTLELKRPSALNKGLIVAHYFAIDKANHIEEKKKLSIWYDDVQPTIMVMKIFSETQDNIPIGSHCEEQTTDTNCYLINVDTNELLTFHVLVSDRISGVKSTWYRIINPFEVEPNWLVASSGYGAPGFAKLELQFSRTGIYQLQLKGNDIAGNETEVKTFFIWVNKPEM